MFVAKPKSYVNMLQSLDSYKRLMELRFPTASTITIIATNADSYNKYVEAVNSATNDYDNAVAKSGISSPEALMAVDALQEAEEARNIALKSYEENQKRFDQLLKSLEFEYMAVKRSDEAGTTATTGGPGPIPPPQPNPPAPPAPPAITPTKKPTAPKSTKKKLNPVKKPNKTANKKPAILPGAVANSTKTISVGSTYMQGCPAGTTGAGLVTGCTDDKGNRTIAGCPPGTTGTSIASGCTDKSGNTFIA